MFKFLTGFLILAILTVISLGTWANNANAAPVPSSPRILPNQSFAFENVIEEGDILAIASYEIDWNTDTDNPPAYTPQDALAMLTNFSNVTYNSFIKNVPYLPGGLVAFYLTPDQVTDEGIVFGTSELRILIQSNPTSFDDSKNSGITGNSEWVFSDDVAETKSLMEQILPAMVGALQPIYPSDVLVTSGQITGSGSDLALAAFSPLNQIAPNAFAIAVNPIFDTPVDPETGTPLENDINTTFGNTPAFLGLTGFASGIGIDRAIVGLAFALGLSIPIIYTSKQYFNSLTLGFAATSGLLVWWAAIGMMPIAIIFMLDLFMIAIIGIYIWRMLPVN